MTDIQKLMALGAVAIAAYLFWPWIKARAGRFYAWWTSRRPADGAPTGPTSTPGVEVTAEQAQAAELTLARFTEQAKPGPVRDLIANGIITLADKLKPATEGES